MMNMICNRIKQREMPSLGMRNPSNTNCIFWGGKLLSVNETGIHRFHRDGSTWLMNDDNKQIGAPYSIDPYNLCTLGIDNLNGELKDGQSLSAHYRVDTTRNVLIVACFTSPATTKGSLRYVF
jgi:carotenoid cleavage dioxygenase-like enzyme